MIIRSLLLTLISLSVSAQEFSPAPFLAMGKAALAQNGIFTLQTNPAGAIHVSAPTVGSAYQQHFGNSGISSQSFNIAIPTFYNTVVGVTLLNYGIFDVSSLLRGGVSFIRGFGKQLSASVTANYHQYLVQQYESDAAYSVDLGFQYQASSTFRLGVFCRNVANQHFSTNVDQRIAQETGVGILIRIAKELDVAADVVYENDELLTYKTGLAYYFDRRFLFRGGISSHPITYSAGLGFRSAHWQIDMASSFHAFLGSSPQVSMSYAF